MSSEHYPETFLEAMQDVKPLKPDDKLHTSHYQSSPSLAQQLKKQAIESDVKKELNPLSLELINNIDPYDFIFFKKDGVQEGVFKKLKQGKYQIDSRLNLQRFSPEQARDEIFESITQSQQRGIRVILLQHGLGLKNKPVPALIKSYINQWLPQLPQVLAFHTAIKAHGGLTSVYILLKKSEQQKLENRELHRKK